MLILDVILIICGFLPFDTLLKFRLCSKKIKEFVRVHLQKSNEIRHHLFLIGELIEQTGETYDHLEDVSLTQLIFPNIMCGLIERKAGIILYGTSEMMKKSKKCLFVRDPNLQYVFFQQPKKFLMHLYFTPEQKLFLVINLINVYFLIITNLKKRSLESHWKFGVSSCSIPTIGFNYDIVCQKHFEYSQCDSTTLLIGYTKFYQMIKRGQNLSLSPRVSIPYNMTPLHPITLRTNDALWMITKSKQQIIIWTKNKTLCECLFDNFLCLSAICHLVDNHCVWFFVEHLLQNGKKQCNIIKIIDSGKTFISNPVDLEKSSKSYYDNSNDQLVLFDTTKTVRFNVKDESLLVSYKSKIKQRKLNTIKLLFFVL